MWVSKVTQPNIAQAVHLMAQFASNPTTRHHEMVNNIFQYLKHTMDHLITLEPANNPTAPLCLETYSDADWAGDKVGAKSTTGFLIQLNGIVIDWKSQLQSTDALSTTNAEVIALSDSARRAIGLKNVL